MLISKRLAAVFQAKFRSEEEEALLHAVDTLQRKS